MEFKDLEQKAIKVRNAYTALNRIEGHKTWDASEHLQGLMGDVGDLAKLVMAKKGFWFARADIDAKLGHELADCLYAIVVIADELNIDLEKEFIKTMADLNGRIQERDVLPKENT